MKLFTLLLVLAVFVGLSVEQSSTLQLPAAVIADMASPRMRYHHLFFHNLRQFWALQTPAAQYLYERKGWKPPRISKAWTAAGMDINLQDNDAGEDFFYMHIKMSERFNRIAAESGSSIRVKGFSTVPSPGNTKYPVPPAYNVTVPGQEGFTASIAEAKTEEFYWDTMKPEEDALNDPDVLRSLTLGQLGSRIEYGLHAWMHLRFSAASPLGYRMAFDSPTPRVDAKWNVPEYDWLVDFYASQVNPIFWRIHGWVNNKFEDWKAANNIEDVQWKGTWQSGPMETLEELFDVIAQANQTPEEPTDDTDDSTSDDTDDSTSDVGELDQDTVIAIAIKLLKRASKDD